LITLGIGLLTMLRVSAVIIGCLTVTPLAWGQADATGRFHASALASAEVVSIGTLHQSVKFPWIDGWNERGYIEVERVLKGAVPGRRLPFAWERDFLPGWCITRPDWRWAAGRREIWLLTRDGNRYRARDLFDGFLEPDSLTEVIGLLAGKSPR
jgi:hypothetical protein